MIPKIGMNHWEEQIFLDTADAYGYAPPRKLFMATELKTSVDRWVNAQVINVEIAHRILHFESERIRERRTRWPILGLIGIAALLLGAGVLLFVAAHWDDLSPWSRFSLILGMMLAFHIGGMVAAKRSPHLSMALHLVGTIVLGAGIYLTGQIFNLAEHWPGGLMLWALGAWIGYLLLRDWGHFALAAILTPAWLAGEWDVATEFVSNRAANLVILEGLLLLAIVYFVARGGKESYQRTALMWIGGLALIPCWAALRFDHFYYFEQSPSTLLLVIGWTIAMASPLTAGYVLRSHSFLPVLASAAWVVVFGAFPYEHEGTTLLSFGLAALGPFLWTLGGGMALAQWGMAEHRPERVNLGIAFIAISIFAFYFSYLMDKLGRSQMLISLGLLMLAGSWLLERSRRRLLLQMVQEES